MDKKIPSKEEIMEVYSRYGVTISALARLYNTNNPTVRKWLISYGIERKSHQQASTEANNRNRIKKKPTKENLEKLYVHSSIKDLESYFNVGQQTIYQWFEEYAIPIKTLAESCFDAKQRKYETIQFSRDELLEKYNTVETLDELANLFSVSRSHIRSQLIKNGIAIRPTLKSFRSKAEIELFEYLNEQFPDDLWTHNDRNIIPPLEIDIANHSKKICIEYCGLYWHSETSSGKNRNYHNQKYKECEARGYSLVTIFESDDIEKVKKLLCKKMGKTVKIHGRKTGAKQITSKEAMNFHNEHHLHGGIGAAFHYGLYHGDELVMCASFGKNRFSDKYEYECTRITSHSNYTVIGGVSKLIKNFITTENPKSIITFSDLRFGDGGVYLKCGFERISDTPPNYWYHKKYIPILYSRVKFQKHTLEKQLEFYDPKKTEYENMLDNGWDRIWDCGNSKYVWQSFEQ